MNDKWVFGEKDDRGRDIFLGLERTSQSKSLVL